MAKQVLANESKADLLEERRAFMNDCSFYLFTAVAGGVITGATLAADFTEPTDTGYAPQNPSYTAAVLNAGNQGEMTAPDLVYTFDYSGGVPFVILGFFVLNDTTGRLVTSQFGGTPVTISAAGQTYTVSPKELLDTMP